MNEANLAAAHALVDEIAALIETAGRPDVSDPRAADQMITVIRLILAVDDQTMGVDIETTSGGYSQFLMLLRNAAESSRGRLAGIVSVSDWMASATALALWPHDTGPDH